MLAKNIAPVNMLTLCLKNSRNQSCWSYFSHPSFGSTESSADIHKHMKLKCFWTWRLTFNRMRHTEKMDDLYQHFVRSAHTQGTTEITMNTAKLSDLKFWLPFLTMDWPSMTADFPTQHPRPHSWADWGVHLGRTGGCSQQSQTPSSMPW